MKASTHEKYFEDAGLNLNCKKASYLVSVSCERKLSFKEKVGLFFHFIICKGCRLFKKQNFLLNDFLKRKVSAESKIIFSLNKADKEILQEKINQELK